MAAPTKIKVSRVALLQRLEEIETELQEKYLNAQDVYHDEFEDFCITLCKQLDAFRVQVGSPSAQDVRELLEERTSANYSRGLYISFPELKLPVRPSAPGDDLGKLIRTLELSTEDTIVVSASDSYYRYL